ncbi:MAG: hypothetical protein R3Y28_07645 [Candidatus Gastranaerophilales bacterium]
MNFIKTTFIILFIISTLITVAIQPEIHQQMIIEDADFKVVRISDLISNENIVAPTTQTKSIEIKPSNDQTKTTHIKQKTSTSPEIEHQRSFYTHPDKQTKTKKDNIQLDLLENLIASNEEEKEEEETPQPENWIEQINKVSNEITKKNETNNPNSDMSEDEIIAWNKWRSDLLNKIMVESQIEYAPLGTLFTYSFKVDKFGNVSNIKVECSNPEYNDVAQKNVKSAIQKLHKKSILDFPKGTQRSSTVADGIFIIGTQQRFSTPNDYADFERIFR